MRASGGMGMDGKKSRHSHFQAHPSLWGWFCHPEKLWNHMPFLAHSGPGAPGNAHRTQAPHPTPHCPASTPPSILFRISWANFSLWWKEMVHMDICRTACVCLEKTLEHWWLLEIPSDGSANTYKLGTASASPRQDPSSARVMRFSLVMREWDSTGSGTEDRLHHHLQSSNMPLLRQKEGGVALLIT